MSFTVNRMIKAMRADISALLLIAFLFQLLTPVVVLAGERSEISDFEAQMRASICRVDVLNADDPAKAPSHTDGFVCELCILCSIDTPKEIDFLPDVVFHNPLDGLPQLYEGIDAERLLTALKARPSAPRAPPFR
ncbi:hypothetical protein [Terasakiella sp. SH-1]|uniref:hypothetical protein n=1 Tax=Terasakiella sp. SH-1 TaxID=2560057 RepID=UPI0010748BFD|nr:hypothetical protein [Terasakiella sp. SH-1]